MEYCNLWTESEPLLLKTITTSGSDVQKLS